MTAFWHSIISDLKSGQRVNHVGIRVNYDNGWAQSYESENDWIYNYKTGKPKQTKSIKIVSIVHTDRISYECTITYYNDTTTQNNFSVDPWVFIHNYTVRARIVNGNDDYSFLKFVEPNWVDIPKNFRLA